MNELEKDRIFFRFQKGHYAPGGKWENATQPMGAGKVTSRPQAMYRNHSVVSSAEPEYTPMQMVADPFDGSVRAKAGALEVEMPEPIAQDAEAQNVYTPPFMFAPAAR